MRNLLSNLVPPQLLHFPHSSEETSNGSNQTRRLNNEPATMRLTAFRQRTGRIFYRQRTIDPLFDAPDPARARAASVTFEPGARTAWHTHPLGQNLIVTSGCGWVQSEGAPKEEIRPGDVVSCPRNEKHWHGATSTTAMTHIAIQEQLDGKVVEWLEKVSDEQYQAANSDQ